MDRAYSLLEVKSFDEDAGIIRGIATTPMPDRIGDIVEPKGAKFKLPLPLLWQHGAGDPIGKVTSAQVTDAGIEFEAKIATGLLPEIDRAWKLIKAGLVRGVSIGFRALEDGAEPVNPKDPWGAIRFKSWEWLELSAVTIPANAQATIQTIKSADVAARGRGVVRLTNLPGASGHLETTKGIAMKTIQERMAAWEAKRQATDAARAEIMKKAEDDGDRTLTEEEKTQYKGLTVTLTEVDEHLGLLRDEETRVKATAKAVTGDDPDKSTTTRRDVPHILSIKAPADEPGMMFARYVKCHMLAKGNPMLAQQIGKSLYPNHPRLHVIFDAEAKHGEVIAKANVLAATTTDATWAGALVQYQDIASEFVEWLRPQTIVGKFGTDGIPALTRVPFNARVRAQTSGGTAYWTGEGKPKPLTKFDFSNITMAMTKIACIAVVTQETLRLASPSADVLVRNALRGAVLERMDRDFIDPDFAGTATVSPASITYGAPTAAATGTTNPYITADTGTAVDSLLANLPDATLGGLVWLMSGRRAYRLSQAQNSLGQPQFGGMSIRGGNLGGIPVITSEYLAYGGGLSPATNDLLVLVHAPSIFLADDGEVSIDASSEASLQMLDNPTNDTVTPTATTMVSMYQTNSVAIRAERAINWKVARVGAVYVITAVAYSGLAA